MNFEEFCESTKRTFNVQSPEKDLLHCKLGMAEESGEIIGKFKKVVGYGHELDRVCTLAEIGDYMFYFGYMCNILEVEGIDTEEMKGKDIVESFNNIVSNTVSSEKVIPATNRALGIFELTATFLVLLQERPDIFRIIQAMSQILLGINMLCASLGKKLPVVLEANVAKLKLRYPDKFNMKATHEEGRDRAEEDKVVEEKVSKSGEKN